MTVKFSCTACGGPTGVTDSRPALGGDATRRRRKCRECGARFSTAEIMVPEEGVVIFPEGRGSFSVARVQDYQVEIVRALEASMREAVRRALRPEAATQTTMPRRLRLED